MDLTPGDNVTVRRKFIRGSTLMFELDLPDEIHPEDLEEDENMTLSLRSHLRRLGDASKDGFIADLRPILDVERMKILFHAQEYDEEQEEWVRADTSNWPIGPVEFDVVIIQNRTDIPDYTPGIVRFEPLQFDIVDGVTQQ